MNKGTFIHINGVVQEVGLLPWVWRPAARLRTSGSVRNDGDGLKVKIPADKIMVGARQWESR